MVEFKTLLYALLLAFLVSCGMGDSGAAEEESGGLRIQFDKNADGATGDMTALYLNEGETVELPGNRFILSGYDFAGWSGSGDGPAEYPNNGTYVMGGGDDTLYALWEDGSRVDGIQVYDFRGIDADPSDHIGAACAVSGLYAAVGVFGDDGTDDTLIDAGCVHILYKNAGSWTHLQTLRASDAQAGDFFGVSVAMEDDLLVVGAREEDGGDGDPLSDSGAAYVFRRTGQQWNQEAILRGSGLSGSSWFGWDVDVSGDTVAVSSTGYDTVINAGGVFIFDYENGSWTEKNLLLYDDPFDYDNMGERIALDGDTLLAGCRLEDGGNANPFADAGAVVVFRRSSGLWSQEAVIHHDDMDPGDYFGYDVALDGDVALITAANEDCGSGNPVPDGGSAYIYRRSGSVWSREAVLRDENAQSSDTFGYSCALDYPYAAVGAYAEDGGDDDLVPAAGGVYLYEYADGAWSESAFLHASDMQDDDRLGNSLDMKDGSLIIGAIYEDGGDGDPVLDGGAAYIFH